MSQEIECKGLAYTIVRVGYANRNPQGRRSGRADWKLQCEIKLQSLGRVSSSSSGKPPFHLKGLSPDQIRPNRIIEAILLEVHGL